MKDIEAICYAVMVVAFILAFPIYYGLDRYFEHKEIMAGKREPVAPPPEED